MKMKIIVDIKIKKNKIMETRNDLDYANSQPNEDEIGENNEQSRRDDFISVEIGRLKSELEWYRTYGSYIGKNYPNVDADACAYADGDDEQ
jgi:hypothetical protein